MREEASLQLCSPVSLFSRAQRVRFQLHTYAMRQAAYEKYGLITPHIKKLMLCYMYKDLVGDSSAAATTYEAELDERVRAFLS